MILDLFLDVMPHLRITDFATDDERTAVYGYMQAACEHVAQLTGTDYSGEGEVPPFSVKAAALLICADLYENREAQTFAQGYENKTVVRLLAPFRVY